VLLLAAPDTRGFLFKYAANSNIFHAAFGGFLFNDPHFFSNSGGDKFVTTMDKL
jgi:hypothetical protein